MSSNSNKPLPSHYVFYPDYLKTLEELKYYHQDSLGLTDYSGASASDKIYPKQNNSIIALLISLHKKVDTITEKVRVLQIDKFEKDLEEITDQFKKLPVTKKESKPHLSNIFSVNPKPQKF